MASTNNQFDSNMSIYIPRCDTRSLPRRARGETDEAFEDRIANHISKTLEDLRLGKTSRIDILAKQTQDGGHTYYIAFVHLCWKDTPANRRLQAMINDPDVPAKLYYSPKWFWHINKNSNPLSAEEAAFHKRVYNLERELLKTYEDSEAVYVEILREIAPDAWSSLYAFSRTFQDPATDLDSTMREHVRAFIPAELHTPLRITPTVRTDCDVRTKWNEIPLPEELSAARPEGPVVVQNDDEQSVGTSSTRSSGADIMIRHLDEPTEAKLVARYSNTVRSIPLRKRQRKQKRTPTTSNGASSSGNNSRKWAYNAEDFPPLPQPKLRRSTADEVKDVPAPLIAEAELYEEDHSIPLSAMPPLPLPPVPPLLVRSYAH